MRPVYLNEPLIELSDIDTVTSEELNGFLQAMVLKLPEDGVIYYRGHHVRKRLFARKHEINETTKSMLVEATRGFSVRSEGIIHHLQRNSWLRDLWVNASPRPPR